MAPDSPSFPEHPPPKPRVAGRSGGERRPLPLTEGDGGRARAATAGLRAESGRSPRTGSRPAGVSTERGARRRPRRGTADGKSPDSGAERVRGLPGRSLRGAPRRTARRKSSLQRPPRPRRPPDPTRRRHRDGEAGCSRPRGPGDGAGKEGGLRDVTRPLARVFKGRAPALCQPLPGFAPRWVCRPNLIELGEGSLFRGRN